MSRGTWQTFLVDTVKRDRAGGANGNADIEEVPRQLVEYPDGEPLAEMERNASRNHRPRSTEDGLFLCWDFHHVEDVGAHMTNAQVARMGSSNEGFTPFDPNATM